MLLFTTRMLWAFYSFQIMLIGCYLIMGLEKQKTECQNEVLKTPKSQGLDAIHSFSGSKG